jgi:succinylglutamate desuccinylase
VKKSCVSTNEKMIYTDHLSEKYQKVYIEHIPLDKYSAGNTGIPYTWSYTSKVDGPHIVIFGIMHGNELVGAHVLSRILDREFRPARGKITFCFGNIEAYKHFDPLKPQWFRFIDTDINRIWGPELDDPTLNGMEYLRARELRPIIDAADAALDIHTMHCNGVTTAITGINPNAEDLAIALPNVQMVMRGTGMDKERLRLREYSRFQNSTSSALCLQIQCGQHWRPESIEAGYQAVLSFIDHYKMLPEAFRSDFKPDHTKHILEISELIWAHTGDFHYMDDYENGRCFPHKGTLVAMDGDKEIRSPHDEAYLIMPGHFRRIGFTVGRFGRKIERN